jgi:cyclohexanone monooxygenase
VIAQEAEQLYVFQRTPQFAVPAWNRRLSDQEYDDVRSHYPHLRESAWGTFEGVPVDDPDHEIASGSQAQVEARLRKCWNEGGFYMLAAYPDVLFSDETNAAVGEWVKERIRERIDDPSLASKLIPNYPFGAKRLCVDTEYFEIFNRPNVSLVDLSEDPIKRATASGIETKHDRIELDVLVLATGFDAMTGALLAVDPRGRGGVTLRDKWAAGPSNYFGIMTTRFPNFYMVNGPGSPSVLYNMVASAEQHVDWIADVITFLDENGYDSIEPEDAAEREWTRYVDDVGATTVFPKVRSWYMGSNVSGKVERFLPYAGGGPPYFDRMKEAVEGGYSGFRLSRAEAPVGEP